MSSPTSGASPNVNPAESGSPIVPPPGPTPFSNAMSTQVRTLADIQNVLIQNLGEQKGTQMYNLFLSTLLTPGFTAIQSASQKAQQAASQMTQNQ